MTLRAMGDKFAVVYGELATFLPKYEAACDKRDQEIARRIGIPAHCNFRSEVEASSYCDELGRVEQEMGIAPLGEKIEEIYSRLDPIVRAIRDMPASDFADLAVKAQAVASVMQSLWESAPDDLDYDKHLIRDLLENICGLANVDLLVRNTRWSPGRQRTMASAGLLQ